MARMLLFLVLARFLPVRTAMKVLPQSVRDEWEWEAMQAGMREAYDEWSRTEAGRAYERWKEEHGG